MLLGADGAAPSPPLNIEPEEGNNLFEGLGDKKIEEEKRRTAGSLQILN